MLIQRNKFALAIGLFLLFVMFAPLGGALAQSSFYLDANNVTVRCEGASVGSTGMVEGVSYTKRSEAQLRALVANREFDEVRLTCTSGIENMSGLFVDWALYDSADAFNEPIAHWDTSAVTDMSEMFMAATSFNQPIGDWDTSRVTSMRQMFEAALVFNQPIGGWDTARVTTMAGMFMDAFAFNQPIGDWDTGRVEDFSEMFSSALAFNQPIGNWNLSSARSLYSMFAGAGSFNQPIGGWDTRRVTFMRGMFHGAESFNQPIGDWNTSQVVSMVGMFSGAVSFNQPIGTWDTRNVLGMNAMFSGASSFNQPIGRWNTRNVTNMWGMFAGAEAFNQPIGSWDTSKVESMAQIFDGSAFNQSVANWNVDRVQDLDDMFFGAEAYTHRRPERSCILPSEAQARWLRILGAPQFGDPSPATVTITTRELDSSGRSGATADIHVWTFDACGRPTQDTQTLWVRGQSVRISRQWFYGTGGWIRQIDFNRGGSLATQTIDATAQTLTLVETGGVPSFTATYRVEASGLRVQATLVNTFAAGRTLQTNQVFDLEPGGRGYVVRTSHDGAQLSQSRRDEFNLLVEEVGIQTTRYEVLERDRDPISRRPTMARVYVGNSRQAAFEVTYEYRE